MTDSPADVLAWIARRGRYVSVVGAGGKTTLLYALAHEAAAQEKKCIVTTSTHIWQPKYLPVAEDLEELKKILSQSRLAVFGQRRADGKLGPPGTLDAAALLPLADFVWNEADGGRGLPCKVPAAHEPVIPADTDVVLGVAGLSALGRPLKDVCFRPEQAESLLGRPAAAQVRGEDLAAILLSEAGTRRSVGSRPYAAVLHQCDSPQRAQQAEQIRALLGAGGLTDIFVTARSTRRPQERS